MWEELRWKAAREMARNNLDAVAIADGTIIRVQKRWLGQGWASKNFTGALQFFFTYSSSS